MQTQFQLFHFCSLFKQIKQLNYNKISLFSSSTYLQFLLPFLLIKHTTIVTFYIKRNQIKPKYESTTAIVSELYCSGSRNVFNKKCRQNEQPNQGQSLFLTQFQQQNRQNATHHEIKQKLSKKTNHQVINTIYMRTKSYHFFKLNCFQTHANPNCIFHHLYNSCVQTTKNKTMCTKNTIFALLM